MLQIVTYLYPDEIQRLGAALLAAGWAVSADSRRPLIAQNPDTRVYVFSTGKLLAQGRGVEVFLDSYLKEIVCARYGVVTAGSDESGKGDYFGPLVVAACRLDRFTAERMLALSVQDSKSVSDERVEETAKAVADALYGAYSVVTIGNRRYNELLSRMRSVNRLLEWAHAKALRAVIADTPVGRVIVDRFGDPQRLRQRLPSDEPFELIVVENGERELPVAAASILARAHFLKQLRNLSQQLGITLPKGAGSAVISTGKELVKRYGQQVLQQCAKMHFKTTRKVLYG